MSHPALQAGWIDRPHLLMPLGDLPTEGAQVIRDAFVSYVVHGALERDKPVVLCLSAIASTHHRLDFLIGPGKALDPEHCTVIAVDALGNGLSISPSNSPRQARAAFPAITVRDMVSSQSQLLDRLGIDKVHAIVGASMGGMQALQWAVSEPDRADHVVAMTPMARTAAWARLLNETSRRILQTHPNWSNDDPAAWDAWVPLMQMINSRTPDHWDEQLVHLPQLQAEIDQRVQAWKAQRYSIWDWLCQSHAYDAHDVGSTPGHSDTESALASIRARTLILAPPLDLYNPADCARWAAERIARCQFTEIPSRWGHQAASAADAQGAAFLQGCVSQFLWPTQGR
jgi:homoserine O-acetyltransferase